MKPVYLATGLLQNEKGEVLFLQRSSTSIHWPLEWQFPEGKIEAGESAEEAVRREIKEETGLNVHKRTFLGKRIVRMTWKDEDVLAHRDVFLVEWSGTPVLSEEHRAYQWVNVKHPQITYYKGTLEILELLPSRI